MMNDSDEPAESPTDRQNTTLPEFRAESQVLDSQDLLRGAREVLIDHQGSLYRLRLTRTGKLILHK